MKVLADVLNGIGGEWQMWEDGDVAKHTRRRLSPAEMAMLFEVLPTAPVFTHGGAMAEMKRLIL